MARGVGALSDSVRESQPESMSYTPRLLDAWVTVALAHLGPTTEGATACVQRLRAAFGADGLAGSVLETAMAARALALVGPFDDPRPVAAALVRLQNEDGGYAPCPFFRTVAARAPRTYGSRAVTTAAVLAALQCLSGVRGSVANMRWSTPEIAAEPTP